MSKPHQNYSQKMSMLLVAVVKIDRRLNESIKIDWILVPTKKNCKTLETVKILGDCCFNSLLYSFGREVTFL